MKKHFKTTMDTYAISITIIVVSILCILSAGLLFMQSQNEEFWILLTCNIVLFISIIVAFLKMPLSIIVTENGLLIKRTYGNIFIAKADILSITPVPYSPVNLTSGTHGVFGYLGSGMDSSTLLVTNRKDMVQLLTKNRKIVFSCKGFDEFKISPYGC